MTDLIIHIGLSKSASTTLQSYVVPTINQGSISKENYDELARELYRIYVKDWSDLKRWCEHTFKNIRSSCKDLLISNEHFSSGLSWSLGEVYDTEWRNIFNFLKKLKNTWGYGNVKAILIVRNQPDWLASRYAQSSSAIPGASQKNFEYFVKEKISNNYNYLNWSLWVAELEKNLGSENVLTLLMEELDSHYFWVQLFDFIKHEAQDFDLKDFYLNIPQSNKKKKKENIWNISDFGAHRPNEGMCGIIRSKWSIYKYSFIRGALLKFLRSDLHLINIDRVIYRNVNRQRDSQIYLHRQLRKKILDYCLPFNIQLKKQLDHPNLHKLGYFDH